MKNKAKYPLSVIFTLVGFVLAILENTLVPQIADGVEFHEYVIAGLHLDMNAAYRIFLVALMAVYAASGIVSWRREEWKQKYIQRANFRFALGIAMGIWDLLGTKLLYFPQPFFPGPAKIMESFLMEGGFILENTLYSLRLYVFGFSFGVLFGVGTGILVGWFDKVHYWISPVLNISGVIPAVAWMPFALTIFPTPFAGAVFLIVICAWFPIASLTASGIRSTPKAQFDAARTLGGSNFYMLFHVAVPHAMPQIFTGISSANAFAFTTLVMAEMLGQPGGLGYYINTSKVWSAYYKIFAAIVVMAVLFSLIMKGINAIKNYVLRWQRGLLK